MLLSVMLFVKNTWLNALTLCITIFCIWKVYNYRIWCWPYFTQWFVTSWTLSFSDSIPSVLGKILNQFLNLFFPTFFISLQSSYYLLNSQYITHVSFYLFPSFSCLALDMKKKNIHSIPLSHVSCRLFIGSLYQTEEISFNYEFSNRFFKNCNQESILNLIKCYFCDNGVNSVVFLLKFVSILSFQVLKLFCIFVINSS